MTVKERIEALRKLMAQNGIDAYIVANTDPHQSEYIAEHWREREWISGFTGSAGTVVVTMNEAGLWTDGRYYIQAETELKGSGVNLFRAVDLGVPTIPEWLRDNVSSGCIGINGQLFSAAFVKDLEKEFGQEGLHIKDKDLIAEIWEDRPGVSERPAILHDVRFAGKNRQEKLAAVRQEMAKKRADYFLLTVLDDIAWFFNLRGSDIPNNPVVESHALIGRESVSLFINDRKLLAEVRRELEADCVTIRGYDDVLELLKNLQAGDKIWLDPAKVNFRLYNAIPQTANKLEEPNITTRIKAIKNEVELDNLRRCHIRDSVAMVKFLRWLDLSVGKQEITEISADEKLKSFRAQQDLYLEPSFDTIAGYRDHAALMHYKAAPETTYKLERKGFFLVDSGGQYLDGTIDITRTVMLGTPTEEEKRDFTLVLKAMINLSTTRFLYGAYGFNLDIMARKPLWDAGIDYKCGTGHGVGFCLNVHEGPQSISMRPIAVRLEKGMILTNEPGIYREGVRGIRTENTMVVVEDEKTDFGQFMKFETISLCPIDLYAIDVSLLTVEEMIWLNNYHRKVYEALSPYLNDEETVWLQERTKEI